jgi:hypothetical protein
MKQTTNTGHICSSGMASRYNPGMNRIFGALVLICLSTAPGAGAQNVVSASGRNSPAVDDPEDVAVTFGDAGSDAQVKVGENGSVTSTGDVKGVVIHATGARVPADLDPDTLMKTVPRVADPRLTERSAVVPPDEAMPRVLSRIREAKPPSNAGGPAGRMGP